MTTPLPYAADIRDRTGQDRAGALDALVADLGSPEPAVRDDGAYCLAVRWIPALDPGERVRLGDRMAERFTDQRVQARTFAPLILARIVEAGEWRREWWRAFADWYPAEHDLRGYDPERGWLHAAAHGADLLAVLARRPGQDPMPLAALAAARLLAATDHVFDAQEDDRIAYALARILSHPALTEAGSVRWLTPVAEAFRQGTPGPVPAWASNTMRTLRMLYLLADRGVSTRHTDEPARPLTHRQAVLDALARTLAIVAPYTG
ncbi:DUF2785 domain-containing protein [Streptomyces actuosus]|uniref:DUF2785 domain-containing protein n=1 Tax=Streptomyces actuosus TaxID=1885 RepID=A0ABS2VTM1_STRAS|nr:DUF2785 domain-containing protein [Streptomyces actuosus]MBN0046477.1 DUF2785 domain-containing protein [Streptomyces actuosus]